jgi:DNA polymerase-3 subunit chi
VADAPCEVWFYHLERTALEQVLPELLEKTLGRGWRAKVRSMDPSKLEALDALLWTYRDESFLPHGLASEPHAERQPVLLSDRDETPNGAEALFVVDGDPGDLAGHTRCVLIFDGRQEVALTEARRLWTRYRKAGHPVTYWRQSETRGWEKQA